MRIIIDATKAAAGRLGSFAAKKALLGNEIIIVNAEKAVITGRANMVTEQYQERRKRGGTSLKGPNFPSRPEFILKRTIRGMLSYKEGRGRAAFRKIRCFAGVPKQFADAEKIKIKISTSDNITLEELSRRFKLK